MSSVTGQSGMDPIGPVHPLPPHHKVSNQIDARVAAQGQSNIAKSVQGERPASLGDKKIEKGIQQAGSQSADLKELDQMLREMGANIPTERELADEKKASDIFDKMVKNPALKKKFHNSEYVKLSRGFTGLDHSYVLQKLNPKDASSRNTRIFKVINGDPAFVGEGGMKKAKAWVATDSRKTFVRAKFKNIDASELFKEYPQMKQVMTSLKNNPVPNTAPGLLFNATNKYLDSEGNISRKETVHVLTEFAESVLNEKIESGELDDSQKMSLARDILRGVSGLHAQGIYHRDLKPANINLVEGQAFLADFDFAVLNATPGPQGGTVAYMAPEVLRGEVQNNKDLERGDAYAIGVTLYQLFNGVHPIEAGIMPDQLEEIANLDPDDFTMMWESKHGVPDPDNSVNGVIYMLMHPDPTVRMSAGDALARLNKLEK